MSNATDITANRIGAKTVVLGLQHTFVMFGATVLVPIITGLDIGVTLICSRNWHPDFPSLYQGQDAGIPGKLVRLYPADTGGHGRLRRQYCVRDRRHHGCWTCVPGDWVHFSLCVV